MSIKKPEVVGYIVKRDLEYDGCRLGSVCMAADSWPGSVALIRLSDYEALQAERDTLLSLLERSSEWVCPPDEGCRCDTCREALSLTEAIGILIGKKVNDNQ